MLNIDDYFSNFLKLNVKKLTKNINNERKENFNEIFNSCLGACKIIQNGWETEAIPKKVDKNHEKTGFFARIFGN